MIADLYHLRPLHHSTLVDHPIPLEHINAAFDLSARYFDLPLDVKMKKP